MVFDAMVAAVAVIAGMVASLAGFGIGSLLTPVLAYQVGTKLAVTLVALPHVGGTALRLWMLRGHVDRHVHHRGRTGGSRVGATPRAGSDAAR